MEMTDGQRPKTPEIYVIQYLKPHNVRTILGPTTSESCSIYCTLSSLDGLKELLFHLTLNLHHVIK